MSSGSVYLAAIHIAQATLAGYGAYVSWIAIKNLQKYEEQSKKAAKVSDTAATQLHRTRTTQAAGAIAVMVNLAVSVMLATNWQLVTRTYRLLGNAGMLIATLGARGHIYNFWKEKSKVPMVSGYNEAITRTQDLLGVLQYLEYSWALTSFVAGTVGYSRDR